ncbi:hypothetical protein QBC37DRAFT_462861 [Rhypophila decipiens]|uniref:F-box domain-containing protein n=1 Tax=Rhypophila decipiens TaxID=261697 RepID=A0AAN6Y898_9PEZI|nr:hypothetical protein QBC37DRAFT_462861 [Rhypophila decipiens]
MASILFSLPNELLIQICKDLDETDTAALWSFAQASKDTYSLAKTHLFHTITFHLTTPKQLTQDVHSCEELLHRNGDDSFGHVRRVVVTGKPVGSVHPRNSRPCDESTWQIHSPPVRWDKNYERLHRVKSLGNPDNTASEVSVFQGAWFLNRSPVLDRDWEPLVNILEVAKYRAIEGFSQLRRLTLTLAAEPVDLPSKEYNDTDYPFSRPQLFKSVKVGSSKFPNVQFLNEEVRGTRTSSDGWRPRKGHLVELMANYALDPELAGSIFRTIWRSNARSRQAESRFSSSGSLERMLIRTWGDSNFWNHPLGNNLARYRQGSCRAYAVKVAPSGGGNNPSGGLVKRELQIGLKGMNDIRNLGSDPRSSELVPYFRNLWPVEEHGVLGSPRGYSSFPLELDATEAMESDVKLAIRKLEDPTVPRVDWA